MPATGPGHNPDIGAKTADGHNTFIGRRPDADNLTAPGAEDAPTNPDPTRRPRTPGTAPTAPRDLKRGERFSPLVDS